MTSCVDSRLHALMQVYHLTKHKSDTKYVFFVLFGFLCLFVCFFNQSGYEPPPHEIKEWKGRNYRDTRVFILT